jgi:type I restriction-modification system DNA methylase subunit
MEKSLELVRQLVSDFREHENAYLAPSYQESQVRQDFIDKFFTALGWDVSHQRQKNPYEQEVKIENKVSTQGSQRRADYAFFVAPNFRDVKFFVEAKKPAHDLANANYYYQTVRYGWNKTTPIAILTDFEEFHILDCRFKPNIKTVLDHKIESFHYSQYTDEDIFKKIFYLFGREAVAGGSLENFVQTLPKPRGKGKGIIRGKYQQVDEAFLELLDGYRDTLAHAFKNKNPHLDGESLTEAVQRTLDRLVFIRFLEDKGIEEQSITHLRPLPNLPLGKGKETLAWEKFLALCRSMEPKYNGLVFKPHPVIDSQTFVAPDDKTFGEICEEISDPTSPYDFNTIPISILGSIYERFLGKIVTTTDKRAKVVEKPEVRKAGGVYYTPEYIVRYIVNETVGKLLYEDLIAGREFQLPTNTREAALSTPSQSPPYQGGDDPAFPLTKGEIQKGSEGGQRKFKLTPTEAAKLKIIDIACGSGSFLLEVYSQLLDYHTRYYNEFPEKAKKGDTETREGKIVLSHKKRQEILVNNIYGVDIDFQATEVTQLSLYLKLMEDVTMNDAYQFSLLKERMLPDLRRNIVCGNSLIGRDILDGKLFDDETERTLKPMNFEDVFPEIMTPSVLRTSPPSQGGDKEGVGNNAQLRGGFDVVAGNPPYRVIGKEDPESHIANYLQSKYSSFQYKADLYHLFIERAIMLLRLNGMLGYITPNTWFTLQFTKNLRNFVLNNSKITKLMIFNHKVFGDANVDTAITLLKKSIQERTNDNVLVWTFPKNFLPAMISTTEPQRFSQSKWQEDQMLRFETRASLQLEQLLSKIKSNSKELGTIARASLGTQAYNSSKHTKEQIAKRIFHSLKKVSNEYLPELAGSDVGRYTLQWQKKEYIKYGSWLHDYRTMEWLSGARLLIREITGKGNYKICATYVEETYCNYKTILNIIYGKDRILSMKFLLGILNSRLVSFIYPLISNKIVKDNFPRLSVGDLRLIPIRTINFDDAADKARHDNIVKFVEQMLAAKAKHAAAATESEKNRLDIQIEALDRQIDAAVYELYGLTEEEIKIVEGK